MNSREKNFFLGNCQTYLDRMCLHETFLDLGEEWELWMNIHDWIWKILYRVDFVIPLPLMSLLMVGNEFLTEI